MALGSVVIILRIPQKLQPGLEEVDKLVTAAETEMTVELLEVGMWNGRPLTSTTTENGKRDVLEIVWEANELAFRMELASLCLHLCRPEHVDSRKFMQAVSLCFPLGDAPLGLVDLGQANQGLADPDWWSRARFVYALKKVMDLWRISSPYPAPDSDVQFGKTGFTREEMEAFTATIFAHYIGNFFQVFGRPPRLPMNLPFEPQTSWVPPVYFNQRGKADRWTEYSRRVLMPPRPYSRSACDPTRYRSADQTSRITETPDRIKYSSFLVIRKLVEVSNGRGYDMILAHVLAPFVAAHPDLNSLSLRLFEPMDISPLFSSLSLLPKLYSLSVTVPLTAPHLGDPDAFADFLNAHTHTLRHLCLRVSDLSSPVFGLIDASLVRWMQTAFYAVRVESLRVLEVGMGLMPVESAQLVVRRFGALDKLILTGRSLTLEEVEGLLPRTMVKRLRIGPVVLSPQMMDVFAECIPDLERLEVVGTDVVPCDGDSVIPDYEHGGQDDSQVAKFVDEMAARTYTTWALRTLELDGRGRCPEERDVWRACVPALRVIML
ncbi:hypothetical protein BDZ89DRAFT_1186874 [Hymenopellis radicata]|nr:hypothetical protein BDZ89DRAFT_1186874 [Hymenopellis radicata]